MINRRKLLLGASALTAGTLGIWGSRNWGATTANAKTFEITRTPEEWKELLSEPAYLVLREHATERPFTSPLLTEKRKGEYVCGGCDLPLYASDAKYDSRTGWPSFFQAINDTAIGTTVDYKLVYPRTEAHCSRCGGHQGHIFDDGPAPTGKRHCINGLALKFVPAA